MKSTYYQPLAALAGSLLATMIFLNGILSNYTTPFISSLTVHGVGFVGSIILWGLVRQKKQQKLVSKKAPSWSYFGGFGGALAVVTANIAVNSPLGLVGSLSCFIVGQTITALVIDCLGLFGSPTRKLSSRDGIRVVSILIGSLLLIQAGGRT